MKRVMATSRETCWGKPECRAKKGIWRETFATGTNKSEKKLLPDEFSSRTYFSPNPLTKWYFYRLLKIAAKISEAKPNDLVLDFGCNIQMLKRFLPSGVQYIGYDIKKEYSDTKNYTDLKPKIVFAINVFEHLTQKEFFNVLTNFKAMQVKQMVVGNPTDNFLSRILQRASGISDSKEKTHLQDFKSVERCLKSFNWHKARSKMILTLNDVTKWEMRE